MSIHIETHTVATGRHVAEVLHTKTREVLHRTPSRPSQANARQAAIDWIGEQVLIARRLTAGGLKATSV